MNSIKELSRERFVEKFIEIYNSLFDYNKEKYGIGYGVCPEMFLNNWSTFRIDRGHLNFSQKDLSLLDLATKNFSEKKVITNIEIPPKHNHTFLFDRFSLEIMGDIRATGFISAQDSAIFDESGEWGILVTDDWSIVGGNGDFVEKCKKKNMDWRKIDNGHQEATGN